MSTELTVRIPCDKIILDGFLQIPKDTHSLVIFVHGSGSSRFSTRNQAVAQILNTAQHATLLFDLLTPSEEQEDEVTLGYRFNIPLLAERLVAVTDWVMAEYAAHAFQIGYFGASTGAAAALVAAAQRPIIKAVVSRGGRPDLAGNALDEVISSTLLIVGGNDDEVLVLNKKAYDRLKGIKELTIIPGATHLFPEPGALDSVAEYTKKWFTEYLKN